MGELGLETRTNYRVLWMRLWTFWSRRMWVNCWRVEEQAAFKGKLLLRAVVWLVMLRSGSVRLWRAGLVSATAAVELQPATPNDTRVSLWTSSLCKFLRVSSPASWLTGSGTIFVYCWQEIGCRVTPEMKVACREERISHLNSTK